MLYLKHNLGGEKLLKLAKNSSLISERIQGKNPLFLEGSEVGISNEVSSLLLISRSP